tara:strand:+ start:594 stop:992 length:399 start_codon:yes stop_codon:yes gene_type:complete
MEISKQTNILQFSSLKIYDFIINIDNYKTILGDEISDFEKLSVNEFKIKIGSMPKISLELVENRPSSSVKLLSNDSNLNFQICITVDSVDNNSSVVYVKFEGKFSTMIEMMIKNPLEKFINSLKNKVEELDF